MPGRRIGKFELLDELGHGGMGVVYRARDVRLDRLVALKLMLPDRAPDEASRARFLRECRAVAALNHPNIATLFEADETADGTLYFAAELVGGRTLADHLRDGPMPLDRALDYARQLAGALAAAHAKGVVHRDVKPSNLMLTPEGRLKVLDFGLAVLAAQPDPAAAEDPTRSIPPGSVPVAAKTVGALLGTPGYMAPEQIRGEPVGPGADIFAAGVVLYELVSGARPFPGPDTEARLHQILHTTPRPVAERNPKVPPTLAAVIGRCLEKHPAARFSNGGELARALAAVTLTGAGPRWVLWTAAAGLVMAVSAGVWWGQRDTLAFAAQDHLLVADVVNTTRDPVFDGALGTALEVDLRQSQYALVVSRREIAEALQLTRRPADAPIDLETALDLARWVGAEAVVVPAVTRLDGTYQLDATIYATESASPVDRVSVVAPSRDAVLRDAVDELTGTLRARLGETLEAIGQTDAPVVKVTTSSWEALEAFRLGTLAFDGNRVAEAARFLDEALERDPDFAAARGQLGLLLIQFLNQPERGRALLAEAAAAADRLTSYERVMLQALTRQFVDDDLDAALDGFRMAASLFPERSEPHQNQGMILRARGRFADAAAAFREAAARAPKSAAPLTLLWFLQVGPVRDPAGAVATAATLLELRPDDPEFAHTFAWSLIASRRFDEAETRLTSVLSAHPDHQRSRVNLAHLVLKRGDAAGAAARYRAILDDARAGRIPQEPAPVAFWLAVALSGAGRADEAAPLFDEAARDAGAPARRALVDAARGRAEEARRVLSGLKSVDALDYRSAHDAAAAYGFLGDADTALAHLARALDLSAWDVYYNLVLPEFRPLWSHDRFQRLVTEGR